jgi:hypothetical protein
MRASIRRADGGNTMTTKHTKFTKNTFENLLCDTNPSFFVCFVSFVPRPEAVGQATDHDS